MFSMKDFKKNNEGSITVEAAFVVPVVFAVFMYLIWMAFYIHDNTVAVSRLNSSGIHIERYLSFGSNLETGAADPDGKMAHPLALSLGALDNKELDKIRVYVTSRLSGGLLLFETENVRVSENMGNIILEADFSFKQMPLMYLISGGYFNYKKSISSIVYINNYSELVRFESGILEPVEKLIDDKLNKE